MRVEIASGREVLETDDITMLEESYGVLGVINRLIPIRKDKPMVVVVLVMVAGNLLLTRTDRIGLDV